MTCGIANASLSLCTSTHSGVTKVPAAKFSSQRVLERVGQSELEEVSWISTDAIAEQPTELFAEATMVPAE